MNNNNMLKKSEKQEIVTDVKKALDKAKGSSNIRYNKKEGKNRSIIVPSVLIILIISAASIYWYLSSNPKTLFIRSTDVVFEKLSNSIINLKNNPSSGTIDTKYKIITGNKELNNYNIKVDYALDEMNNISTNKIKIKKDNNIIDEITFYKNNKNYLLIKELYGKYIYLNDNNFNYNSKDIKIMIKTINNAFLEAINGYKFSNNKVELRIDNKLKMTRQTSLSLQKNDVIIVLDKIHEYLKKDTRFKESYQNVFNTNNFEAGLYANINDIKNKLSNCNNFTINIYTSGFERSFVRLELVKSINNKLNTISITNISKDKYNILIDDNINEKKDNYTISFKEKDNYTYNIDIKKEKNNIKLSDMKIKIKITEKESKKIKKVNTSDVLDYNALSSMEKQKIDAKLNPFAMIFKEITQK